MVKKVFIEIKLFNLTYFLKGMSNSLKMMKFNVSILNRLKIMGFL